MPYCPRCDMEFVEGVTGCSDCGGPLLASEEEATGHEGPDGKRNGGAP